LIKIGILKEEYKPH